MTLQEGDTSGLLWTWAGSSKGNLCMAIATHVSLESLPRNLTGIEELLLAEPTKPLQEFSYPHDSGSRVVSGPNF
jgi:hypothetical protein